jgi:hypothetical protein
MQLDPKAIVDWAIRGIIAFFLIQAIDFMKETKIGLADLSIKLAVIVEKVSNQDKILERHQTQLEDLKNDRR